MLGLEEPLRPHGEPLASVHFGEQTVTDDVAARLGERHPDTAPRADGDLAVVRPMGRYGHGGAADAALVRATCVADREPFVAKGGVGPGEGDLVAVSALGVVEQIELIDDDPLSRGPSLEA